MKELKKKQLNINGVIFNIYSDYIYEIEEYFKNFIVPCDEEVIAIYNIYFDKDENVFNKLLKEFDISTSTSINTFKNQIHYKKDNMFLIDTKDYICIKNSANDYKVFANGKNCYRGLSWIVRELLIRELEDNNYYCMHGTGIKIYDKGILLLGSSGSGKTTFTTKMNEIITPQKFISNDRVFVKNEIMYYYPLSIKYAMGTTRNSLMLNEYFRKNKIVETKKGLNYDDISDTCKCDVPLTDIPKIFPHIENTSKEKIDLIIFPKISEDNLSIRLLSDSEKKEKLNESNFTPIDIETERKEWLKYRKISLEDLKENKERLNQKLINNIPIIEILYPTYLDKDKLRKVLKKI